MGVSPVLLASVVTVWLPEVATRFTVLLAPFRSSTYT